MADTVRVARRNLMLGGAVTAVGLMVLPKVAEAKQGSRASSAPGPDKRIRQRRGTNVAQLQSELGDREAIRECMYRYCHAVDRCDFDLWHTIYWPEATEDHDPFLGSAYDYVESARPGLAAEFDQTHHFIGNILIEIDGSNANVETYFHGYHRLRGEGGAPVDLVSSGRYLDRMERRNGEWRVLARTVSRDWFRKYSDSADWKAGPFGKGFKPGKRNTDDPSYDLFKRL